MRNANTRSCPVCASDLMPVDRQGIEIDCCSHCRGVWLDRGELDKLIQANGMYYGGERQGGQGRDQYDRDDHKGSRPRKKEGLLSRIFDFD